jgi:hypothetical protein
MVYFPPMELTPRSFRCFLNLYPPYLFSILFIKPARTKITYHFKITDEQLAKIYQDLETTPMIRPEFSVTGMDEAGDACVQVRKVIYIRKNPKRMETPNSSPVTTDSTAK